MHNKTRGVLFFMGATVCFALLDASSKYLTAFYAVPLLVWARYLVHLIIMLVAVVPRTGRRIVVTQHPWLLILRSLLLVGCTAFIVLAFSVQPLAETSSIFFITPLLVALVSGPLLGEKVSLKSWLATLAGFCGVLLIARPGGATTGLGITYALSSALCYTFYQILTRRLAPTEPAMRQLFYTAVVGTLTTSLAVPMLWAAALPSPGQALLILSLGMYGGLGHFLFTHAFRDTPAALLSPLQYVQIIWATLLGWIIFGHLPDMLTIGGMLIIGGSGLSLVLNRERKI